MTKKHVSAVFLAISNSLCYNTINSLETLKKSFLFTSEKFGNVIKFSAGYNFINPNFVIQNMDEPREWANPIFAVLHNLLLRGCPTFPSLYLRQEFGSPGNTVNEKYNLDFDDLNWDSIIRGGDTSNPGLYFYRHILPEYIPLAGSFIPEFPVSEILPDKSDARFGQVDFYSPIYNTVIEIDGVQHSYGEQQVKDITRDELFKRNGIRLIRIATSELTNESIVKNKIAGIEKTRVDSIKTKLSQTDVAYCSAIRLQYDVSIEEHENNLLYLLRNVSNDEYHSFRANQLQIITTALNCRSVIGLLPTGAGKSLCYQITALLIPSMTLVVDPLKLLMLDQYEHLCEKLGINNSTYIDSSHTEHLSLFTQEQSLITLVSPERFFSRKFADSVSSPEHKGHIGFIVIDEAHCLSEWGHDFRTSYLCLSHNLATILPSETIVFTFNYSIIHLVTNQWQSH